MHDSPIIMKLTRRLLLVTIAATIALPISAFAAKGNKKTPEAPPDFATVDKDGNGSVSEAEYVAAMKSKLTEDAAKAQFATLDKDKDGELSKEELAAPVETKKKKKKNQ